AKRAGKRTLATDRTTVTSPSSSGWRRGSPNRRGDTVSSSRKSTPRWRKALSLDLVCPLRPHPSVAGAGPGPGHRIASSPGPYDRAMLTVNSASPPWRNSAIQQAVPAPGCAVRNPSSPGPRRKSRSRATGCPGVAPDPSGRCQRQLDDNPPLIRVVVGAHPGKRAAEQLAGRHLQYGRKVAGTPTKRPVQAAECGLLRRLASGCPQLREAAPGGGVLQRGCRRLQRQAGSCRPQRRHLIGELLERGLLAVELAIGADRQVERGCGHLAPPRTSVADSCSGRDLPVTDRADTHAGYLCAYILQRRLIPQRGL